MKTRRCEEAWSIYKFIPEKNNVEISGLRETKHENLSDLFLTMCSNLGANITAKDIDNIHRVKTRNDGAQKPVTVKFTSHKKKDELLSRLYTSPKSGKKLTQKSFGLQDVTNVFISHHMPPEIKLLHKKIRDLGRTLIGKTRVLENGDILVTFKKKQTLIVRGEDELAEINKELIAQSLDLGDGSFKVTLNRFETVFIRDNEGYEKLKRDLDPKS